jgi:hypothetical protein
VGARTVWGDRQPADDAGAPSRGYLRVGRIYDSGLVYTSSSPATERRGYVCERAP